MQQDWASGTLKEVPFWRKDMQPEEYEYERSYFHQNWENFTNGKYNPLWKQAEKCNNFLSVLASFEHEFKIAIYCKISHELIIDNLKSVFINDISYDVIDYNVTLISEHRTLAITLDTNKKIEANVNIYF